MKKVMIYRGFWSIYDVQSRKDHLFLFGDNDIQKGLGGQAIIRNQSNSHGIPTKRYPNHNYYSYYHDKDYAIHIEKIDKAFDEAISKFINGDYEYIVIPEDGLGTGLAHMKYYSPRLFSHINHRLRLLIDTFC